MTEISCPLPPGETIYAEGFTNAQWKQYVDLVIPLEGGNYEKHHWEGSGEKAAPMTGDVKTFKTPEDEKLAQSITANFTADGARPPYPNVNHPEPPIHIGNFWQFTFITEDGGGPDQNDTSMFFRCWRGPLADTPIQTINWPSNRTFYIRAFTNSINYHQKIVITIPKNKDGKKQVLELTGNGEGMEPMTGDKSFSLGPNITEDLFPIIEFYHYETKDNPIKSVLTATHEKSLDTIHQYTYLARNEEGDKHQNIVLCIYHWDPVGK